MANLSPLFSWRSAICDSDLSPTCRHVALTLSLHMNERGGSCFPSINTLAEETGLGRSSVKRSLQMLCEGGWLVKVKRPQRPDGGDTSNEYTAMDPRSTVDPAPCTSGPPPRSTVDPQEDVHYEDVSEDAPLPPKGVEIARNDEFECFWSNYPRKVGKPAAQKSYRAAMKKTTPNVILSGLAEWIGYWTAKNEPQFVPHPSTWLNQERWNDTPPPLPATKRLSPQEQIYVNMVNRSKS